jgi:hypothetical protein
MKTPMALALLVFAACGSNGTGGTGSGGISGTGDTTGTGGGTTVVGQYVVSADQLTVTDTSTGLVWQRDGSGSRPNCAADPDCTWVEAQAYCAGLTLDGSGWRLPTLGELHSIVDTTVTSPPMINQTAFPNTPADCFWTSSPYSSPYELPCECASDVQFSNGGEFHGFEWLGFRVRCVR